MNLVEEPHSEQELLARLKPLEGLSLKALAEQFQLRLPENFQHHKGWLGQLMERVLGASAGAAPVPDFVNLGIELKTIPVNAEGKSLESTFVCAVPQKIEVHWHESLVWQKLKKVLWLPILQAEAIPDRKIDKAFLWQPTSEQEALLEQDWEELSDMLALGMVDQLTAKYGQVLQIRPKAANSRVLKKDIDQEGSSSWIVPRGFYLRSSFTTEILQFKIHKSPHV